MPNDSDPQLKGLFRRLKAGDETAYKPLYPLLRWHCARFVGSTEADDLASETVIRICKALPRIDPTRNPKCLAFKIAHQVCKDWLRKKARRDELMSKGCIVVRRGEAPRLQLKSGGADDGVDPDKTSDPKTPDPVVSLTVRQLLDRLPADLQDIIYYRRIEEFTLEEVAEILGCAASTVRTKEEKALEELRRLGRKENVNER